MSSSPTSSNSNVSFSVKPSSELLGNTTYKIRVTSAAKDTSGNSLTQWNMDSGFTTEVKWRGTVQFGSNQSEDAKSVTIDSLGNVYVTGYTMGNLHGYTNLGNRDIYLAKYNPSGTREWTKTIGSIAQDSAFGVAVDSNDEIYIAGETYGDFDGNTLLGGTRDIAISKFKSNGDKLWSKQFGTGRDEIAYDIKIDSNNSVYITGWTDGFLEGVVNTGPGHEDVFLMKLNPDGSVQWTKLLGSTSNSKGSNSEVGQKITIDSEDNVIVTGWTKGAFDGNTSYGGHDVILFKYNSSGIKQWSKQIGSSSLIMDME